MMNSRRRRWALSAVLLLAFALRLYRLGAESLWYDETVSVYLAGQSLPALIAHTAGDIHPPGYYLLLHAWMRLAGSSEFAVAFLSLFFGLLLVALAWRLAAHLVGAETGLLAAFLTAISPYNLWYSQEVRMYTLGAVLGMGLLAATVRVTSGRVPGWGALGTYALCGALGLWTLYYFAFLLLAINLMAGLWWLVERRQVGWRWLGRWALAQVILLALYAPWLPVAWRQATAPPVPPWREFTPLGRLLAETWSALSLGQSVRPEAVWPVLILFAALCALGLLTGPGRSRVWLPAGYLFLPVLLIYLGSFLTPLYHVRYVFTCSTPFFILIGNGLVGLGRRWRPALWLSLAIIVLFSGASISAYHTDPRYAADDHRAAVHFLAERWRPGDAVLVNAGYAYTALLTYWHGDPFAWRGRLVGDEKGSPPYEWVEEGPVVVQTGTVDGDRGLGWGDVHSDFYAMSRAETEAALERLFDKAHRVWVYRIYDTVTDPDGLIRAWLEGHGTKFEDQVFTGEGQLRVQGYLTGRDPLGGAQPSSWPVLADGSLGLLASHRGSVAVPVGGALDLALVWQVRSPLREEAILFAGLFDEEGQRWAQTDERPSGPLYPVGAWVTGSRVRTPLRLAVPPGTPPGRYRLEAGWYHFVEGQPFWLPWAGGDDRLLLGLVEVVAPAGWWALPLPEVAYPAGVRLGSVRFLGFEVSSLTGEPGGALRLDLFWQALRDGPEQGAAVLQLADEAGQVVAEVSSAPVGGRAPFALLAAGQVIRDPRLFPLPTDLPPGIYTLSLGRRQPAGFWLPVRRGFCPLGTTYPLATVRVKESGLEPGVFSEKLTIKDTKGLQGQVPRSSFVSLVSSEPV